MADGQKNGMAGKDGLPFFSLHAACYVPPYRSVNSVKRRRRARFVP
ncbi:hypothetical protein ABEV41_02045 [Geobacillus thermodenitrificans]|nr:hypothetical protein [Geobacillus thermodenitrificans]